MKPKADSNQPALPVYEPEDDATYSLEVTATLCGIDSSTIIRYQEQGLIERDYDSEALRRIRYIRQLETEYEAGTPVLRLILAMHDELENLRGLLRQR